MPTRALSTPNRPPGFMMSYRRQSLYRSYAYRYRFVHMWGLHIWNSLPVHRYLTIGTLYILLTYIWNSLSAFWHLTCGTLCILIPHIWNRLSAYEHFIFETVYLFLVPHIWNTLHIVNLNLEQFVCLSVLHMWNTLHFDTSHLEQFVCTSHLEHCVCLSVPHM